MGSMRERRSPSARRGIGHRLRALGLLVLARVAIGAPAPAEQATLAPGVESAIMLPNSGGTMQVYLPSNYTATQKWATVFFYHYMGGTADTLFLRAATTSSRACPIWTTRGQPPPFKTRSPTCGGSWRTTDPPGTG